MSGGAFQRLAADGVGDRIFAGGVGSEIDDNFQAFTGDTTVCVGHVGETVQKGFDLFSPLSAVVEVVHG